MCNGQAAIGLQVAGAVQKGVGAFYGARSEARQLEHSANIADMNAKLSDMAADQTIKQGQREAQKSRFETTNTREAALAAYAGNGIALDSATVARVITSSDVLGEIDANTINANAARAAWGYRLEGVQFENEATVARAGAKSISPFTAASTSLISSAGNITQSYIKLKKSGAFDIGKTGRGTGK